MSNRWIEPEFCKTLDVLVETVIAPLLIQHESPVCLEMDVPVDLGVPADSVQTAEMIRALVAQSLVEMPDGGELLVTARSTPNGTELEIADSGGRIESRPRHLPFAAAKLNVELLWQDCPQGGAAVTVVFPSDTQSVRKAA